jgi:hypothetical protein
MGRTTFAGIGIAMALLAAAPVWAASMVDVTGALATNSAASGGASMGASSALRSTKAALQRNLPTFTPPKIDAPVQGAARTPRASGPTASARPTSPSAPAVRGSGNGGAGSWKVGNSAAAIAGKSGWASGAKSSGAARGSGQCWAGASSGARGAAGANAWKAGATASR